MRFHVGYPILKITA